MRSADFARTGVLLRWQLLGSTQSSYFVLSEVDPFLRQRARLFSGRVLLNEQANNRRKNDKTFLVVKTYLDGDDRSGAGEISPEDSEEWNDVVY